MTMEELRRQIQHDYADSAGAPVQGDRSHWREVEKGRICLFIDGEERAEVDTYLMNQGVVVGAGEPERYILPDSMPMMDVLERRLGIGRVDRVIDKNGRPAPQLRKELERKAAAHAREPYASAHEATKLIESAHELLRGANAAKEISPEGKNALRLLTRAIAEHDFFMEWTPKAADTARGAQALLITTGADISNNEDRARFYCVLAVEALERSAELDPPEFQERPGHGSTYWRRADDGFELMVDGHVRATAWHDNSYEIHGSEMGRRELPDSKLHFPVVEGKLGLERVEDFRDEDGISSLASPRAKLEREASDVRQNLRKGKEPIAYLRAALHTLKNQDERGKSSPEAREAAAMLSAALTKLDERNDRWTRPIFKQVFDAKDIFREAIEEERLAADGTEARVKQLCDKALACIGWTDIEEEPSVPSDNSLRNAAIEKAARQEGDRRDRDLERE
jgi:hypothetical protein